MGEKTLAKEAPEDETGSNKKSQVFRVEEDITAFVAQNLPTIGSEKRDIVFLWKTKDQKSMYYRCNFWKYHEDALLVRRTLTRSLFIEVQNTPDGRVLKDSTKSK